MKYDKNTDYSKKMNEAAEKGDYKTAAQYEKMRNSKIDGEKLNYKKTSNFLGHLDTTDYGTALNDQMKSKASKKAVSDTLKKRVSKASNTIGLEKYAYDDIYDRAVKYIMGDNSFSYKAKRPNFKSSYESTMRKALKRLGDVEEFSYNPESDELFGYYKNMYERQGKGAMEDLLGKLSENTGGVASSYATGSAMQAYNRYNEKLTDVIPELYFKKYQKYLSDNKLIRDNIDAIIKMSDKEYERYLDENKAYEKDRDFAYKKFNDERIDEYKNSVLGRNIFEDDRDYLRDIFENDRDYERDVFENDRDYERDVLENDRDYDFDKDEAQYKRMFNQEKLRMDKESRDIDTALKTWHELGYLDEKSAEVLGLPPGLLTSDRKYKNAQEYKLYRR